MADGQTDNDEHEESYYEFETESEKEEQGFQEEIH